MVPVHLFAILDRDTWTVGETKLIVHADGCRDIDKEAHDWTDRVTAWDATHAIRTHLDEVLGIDMDDEDEVASMVADYTIRPCAKKGN